MGVIIPSPLPYQKFSELLLKVYSSVFAETKLKVEPFASQLFLPTCPPCLVHAPSCLALCEKPQASEIPGDRAAQVEVILIASFPKLFYNNYILKLVRFHG